MLKNIGSRLASRPERTAAIVIILAVALLILIAAMVIQAFDIGGAPYPSEDHSFTLVDGNVVYTLDFTLGGFNYTGMMFAFQYSDNYGSSRIAGPFGNQSILGSGSTASMVKWVFESTVVNVNMTITDATGDGSFNAGDSLTFSIDPFSEETVYTLGLAFISDSGGMALLERSFAIEDGKLYAWYSDDLPTDMPWFGYPPYT